MENTQEEVWNTDSDSETSEDVQIIDSSDIGLPEDVLLAVLTASDDNNCTYAKGYVKRQALYACLTCLPEDETDPSQRAGICVGCTLHCHAGHKLVELYTKRNFRCDCGNTKFPNLTCSLCSEKDDINELNQYNHNFSGLFCTCAGPYSDPEDSDADKMTQCVICEDWLHSSHIGVEIPNNFAEMICEGCVKTHEFFLHYDWLTTTDDIVNIEDSPATEVTPTIANEENICIKTKERSKNVSAKFMKDPSWRQQLCTCPPCVYDYTYQKVAFIKDGEDTVQWYEDNGNAFMEKKEDVLNSNERFALLETVAGFNDVMDHLAEYLKKAEEDKKVVRKEDIEKFFSEMYARQKEKMNMPHFCR